MILIIIFGTVEWSLYLYFLSKTLGIKKKYNKILIYSLMPIIILSTTFITIHFTEAFWRPFWGISWVAFVVIFLFGGKRRDKVFYSIALLIIANSTIISAMCMPFLSQQFNMITTESAYQIIYYILAESILFVTIKLFLQVDRKIKNYVQQHNYYVLIGLLGSILLLLLILDYVSYERIEQIMFAAFVLLYLLASVVLLSFYFSARLYSAEKEASMLAYQNEMIDKYVMQKLNSDEMVRVLSHDLKHHLQLWRAQALENGADNIVSEIEEYAENLKKHDMIDVQNDVANAIINQKKLTCIKEHISFVAKGYFDSDLTLNKVDIVALLGNLLDNAIEATKQLSNEKDRSIVLKIKREKRFLLLELENTYKTPPILKNGKYISGKKDSNNHGIGMVSIGQVIENYNGVIKSEFENGFFTTTAMLKAYKNQHSDEK